MTEQTEPDCCPICEKPFKTEDVCADDITEGTCHAECLEGSPVVDLQTGDELPDGKADTYLYRDVMAPPPETHVLIDLNSHPHSQIERSIIKQTVRFVLSHYESGPMPFAPTPVDPDKWWQDMQIAGKVPADLLPKSRAHFEARVRRWQEVALASIETTPPPSSHVLAFPRELTDDLKDVLSTMLWTSGQIARCLRAGGAEIKTRAEDEQAHVLHWLIGLALEHGSEWRVKAQDRIREIRDAQPATTEGSADA